jgi:signal transduction protein with GAF and PtsI domain
VSLRQFDESEVSFIVTLDKQMAGGLIKLAAQHCFRLISVEAHLRAGSIARCGGGGLVARTVANHLLAHE